MVHPCKARWAAVFVAMGVGVATVGCGPPSTIVAGVVTLDGQPVAHAILEFIPERGDAPSAAVQTDGSGRYSVRVSAAPFKVAITAQRSTGEKRVVKSGEKPVEISEDIIPARYTNPLKSELRVEAVDQKRTIANFDLSSKP